MDQVNDTTNIVCPQQIYIENLNEYSQPKKISLNELDAVLEKIAMRKEQSEEIKYQRLFSLLESSIKGKVISGDSIGDLVEKMKNSPIFDHLHNLNNPNLFSLENSALDFGEKPAVVRGKGLFKSCTNAITPCSTKSRLIVEYSECSPKFCLTGAYESSDLGEHHISLEQFTQTMTGATEILRPFRGIATQSDLCFMISTFIGIIVTIALGMILGALISYIITILLSSVFFISILAIFIWLRKRNARLLVYAHLALSLYARCENNRLYLKKKVLIRPGYMSKWVEFNMIPRNTISQ